MFVVEVHFHHDVVFIGDYVFLGHAAEIFEGEHFFCFVFYFVDDVTASFVGRGLNFVI